MRFGTRLFLAFFLLVGLGLVLFLNTAQEQIRPAIRQASEEALVDTANLLAEVAALQFDQGFAADSPFVVAVDRFRNRTFNAQIWSLAKTTPDFSLYITDTNGVVLYHTDASQIGEDYGQWIDVHRTLQGLYGARTTRTDPDDEWSSSMYVAAPIYVRGDRVGVLTVAQPNATVQPFQVGAYQQLWQSGTLIMLVAAVLGGALSFWMARSIQTLVDYVDALRRGQKVPQPVLGERELARLAHATRAMHEEIEGKNYVETYIHTLAHEMKSPLSAIRGASEILKDLPHEPDAERFLDNIEQESRRMQQLIDRLLSLAAVEKQQSLQQVETINLCQLLDANIASKLVALQRKGLHCQLCGCEREVPVRGERFLLDQAISNLLDNAIDFSPDNDTILVEVIAAPRLVTLSINNGGGPIPDFALPRLFERFFSLPRRDSQRKSTGLGLSFVQEVAALHQGQVRLDNRPEGRVEARLTLPPA